MTDVRNRVVAVTTLLAVTGIAACSSPSPTLPHPPGTLPPLTAQVSIDGNDMGMTHDVTCQQVGWTWIIDVGDEESGVTAVVGSGAELEAKSVRIHNVDDFSGSYWDGNNGTADASALVTTWTVTGAVDGFNIDTAGIDHASREFTIKANC